LNHLAAVVAGADYCVQIAALGGDVGVGEAVAELVATNSIRRTPKSKK
jgi:hypothetical protein